MAAIDIQAVCMAVLCRLNIKPVFILEVVFDLLVGFLAIAACYDFAEILKVDGAVALNCLHEGSLARGFDQHKIIGPPTGGVFGLKLMNQMAFFGDDLIDEVSLFLNHAF